MKTFLLFHINKPSFSGESDQDRTESEILKMKPFEN